MKKNNTLFILLLAIGTLSVPAHVMAMEENEDTDSDLDLEKHIEWGDGGGNSFIRQDEYYPSEEEEEEEQPTWEELTTDPQFCQSMLNNDKNGKLTNLVTTAHQLHFLKNVAENKDLQQLFIEKLDKHNSIEELQALKTVLNAAIEHCKNSDATSTFVPRLQTALQCTEKALALKGANSNGLLARLTPTEKVFGLIGSGFAAYGAYKMYDAFFGKSSRVEPTEELAF